MKISDLRSRITIQEKVSTPDGIGGTTTEWSDVVTVWANVKALSTSDVYKSERLKTNTTHTITIRSRTVVTSVNRLVLGSRVFAVTGQPLADTEDKVAFTKIPCVEGAPQ